MSPSSRSNPTKPLADAGLRDDVPIVLFVGRLERVKGLEYLLRAAAKVLESQPMQLVLVGSGSINGNQYQEDIL